MSVHGHAAGGLPRVLALSSLAACTSLGRPGPRAVPPPPPASGPAAAVTAAFAVAEPGAPTAPVALTASDGTGLTIERLAIKVRVEGPLATTARS